MNDSMQRPQRAVRRFRLGTLCGTPGALDALRTAGMDIADLLQRHVTGDWGDVDAEDRETNERAVQHGGQIVSSYVLSTQVKVWVISEADRSVTTLLLPEEY